MSFDAGRHGQFFPLSTVFHMPAVLFHQSFKEYPEDSWALPLPPEQKERGVTFVQTAQALSTRFRLLKQGWCRVEVSFSAFSLQGVRQQFYCFGSLGLNCAHPPCSRAHATRCLITWQRLAHMSIGKKFRRANFLAAF